ncbi:MAG: hypothetical protein ACRDV3_00830 [Acidothermaceae bacterium]
MSGLIGLAIVAIWLVVLVPMWLNRHDAADASRSMDSFSTAMRVLSRRGPAHRNAGDRRYVVMPRRDNWGVTVDNNPHANAGRRLFDGSRSRLGAARIGAAGQARLMVRRRRLALAVVSLMVVLLITAALGVTSWWYELAIDLAAAGFLIHLRNEAIRARELRRRRAARLTRAMAPESADAPAFRRPAAAAFEGDPFISDDEVLPPVPVSAAGTENGSRWEPVPVPLPTYVSKPVVSRPAAMARAADVDATREHMIDLTRPGAWTDEQQPEIDHRHLLLDETGSASSARVPASAVYDGAVYDQDDDELDLILQRRRAVGD